MKKAKPRLSLSEWLMQPPDTNLASFKRSERTVNHIMNFVGLVFLYATSVMIYRWLQYFYHLGLFNSSINLLISLLTLPKQPNSFGTFSIFILMVVGYSLFLFKKYQQFYYGVVETIFALVNFQMLTHTIKLNALGNAKPPYGVWIAAATTLYLMVRGLSNTDDGWKKEFYLQKSIHSYFK